jgi:hypothetical protein
MAGGFTVSPSYNEETGEVTGFDVEGGYEGFQSSDRDFIETNDGQTHHVFENVSIDEGEYSLDQYYETLAVSDERIPGAIQWAADNLPPDLIQAYNDALDADDVDTVQQYLEYILEQYSEQDTEQDTEQVEEEDILLTEEEEQVVQAITEQLAEEPPLGEEAADEWQSVSEQAAASGDQTYADIAALTSSYHAGQISAEEAINWVFQNHSIQDIARVYQHINGG